MEPSLTLYKLIILQMLKKVSLPLTNTQISDFILGEEYTSYFHLQQALSEMVESNLVTVQAVRNTSYYKMTKDGEKTLSYFAGQISDAIQADLDRYLKKNAYEMKSELATRADYYPTSFSEYEVRCRVMEQKTKLIELTLTVPTEDAALAICRNWNAKSASLYDTIMNELLTK